MNESSFSKIVYGLLILFIIGSSSCQRRSHCPHYMTQKEWQDNYQKKIKKDAAINKRRRNQPGKQR